MQTKIEQTPTARFSNIRLQIYVKESNPIKTTPTTTTTKTTKQLNPNTHTQHNTTKFTENTHKGEKLTKVNPNHFRLFNIHINIIDYGRGNHTLIQLCQHLKDVGWM